VITSVEKWVYVQVLTDHSMSKPQNHPMQFSIEMKNEGNGHLSVREMRKIPWDYSPFFNYSPMHDLLNSRDANALSGLFI
jgi:hypothetical protein